MRGVSLYLMCGTLLAGCGNADPEQTKQAIAWLKQHYEVERFLGGKAEFAAFTVNADGNRLQVLVFMPSPSDDMLRGMETPQRHRYWESLACPTWEAPFWGIKDPKHTLVVQIFVARPLLIGTT